MSRSRPHASSDHRHATRGRLSQGRLSRGARKSSAPDRRSSDEASWVVVNAPPVPCEGTSRVREDSGSRESATTTVAARRSASRKRERRERVREAERAGSNPCVFVSEGSCQQWQHLAAARQKASRPCLLGPYPSFELGAWSTRVTREHAGRKPLRAPTASYRSGRNRTRWCPR